MEHLDDPPAFPKLPFIVGDALLICTAIGIALRSEGPLSNGTLIAVVVCVAVGAGLLAVPFILNYSRRQDALLDERQAGLARLTELAANTSEQASIAASGLHEINQQAVTLLASIKETRLAAPITAAPTPSSSAFDADQLLREWSELRTALGENKPVAPPLPAKVELPAALTTLPDEIQALKQVIVSLQAALADIVAREAPAPPPKTTAKERVRPGRAAREKDEDTPGLFPAGLLKSEMAPEAPEAGLTTTAEDDSAPAPEVKSAPKTPSKKGGKDTPATSDPAPSESAGSTDASATLQPPPAPENVATAPHRPKKTVPAAVTSEANQSVTRITATAYIGIGNKLFLRGEGPGLSPDKGVPLQFVSIGKWRWESDQVIEPVRGSLWKNDEIRCDALGEIELAPGSANEVTATF